ncbi:MAG: DUF2171 domain-containing protein [Sphingobium sp.]
MFEKLRIKQHMEVADSAGQHVGTVDELDGDTIKLTRSDSGDRQHHYLDLESVERIEDNRIYLKAGITPQARVAEQQHQSGTAHQQLGGQSHADPATYSTAGTSAAGTPSGAPLFGEAGNGSVLNGANKE